MNILWQVVSSKLLQIHQANVDVKIWGQSHGRHITHIFLTFKFWILCALYFYTGVYGWFQMTFPTQPSAKIETNTAMPGERPCKDRFSIFIIRLSLYRLSIFEMFFITFVSFHEYIGWGRAVQKTSSKAPINRQSIASMHSVKFVFMSWVTEGP